MADLNPPPPHGGDLQRAIAQYGGTAADWLDCSSGIAPTPYPLPPVPAAVWQRLPDGDAALLAAARAYYGNDTLLAVPGSQAAIALLPQLRAPGRVAVLAPSYAEHAWQWREHGHAVQALDAAALDAQLEQFEVLVLVNPNNPTGARFSAAQLLDWHARLARRGGWLLVDEAFADAEPEHSVMAAAGQPGLIVLRSLGKFFGLAGLRLGFVAAEAGLLAALQRRLGPWAVSAPAQWAGSLALADQAWQQAQRQSLHAASADLARRLRAAGLAPAASLALLHWCPTEAAPAWQAALAAQRLWCRRFDAPAGLRFGLPPPQRYDEFSRRLALAGAALQAKENHESR